MASQPSRSRTRRSPSEARAARRARRETRRRLRRIIFGTVVAAIAVTFIASLFLPGLNIGGGSGLFGRSAPDGPGIRVADQGRTHIEPGQDHPLYNSVPAISGWHFPQPLAPVRWGVHTQSLPDENLVHNLEHGGVGVHYDCPEGCDELVDQLADIVRGRGLKVILSPYPGMDTTIALTAWTFIDKFDVFDEQRVRDFIEAHESSPNAPEPTAR